MESAKMEHFKRQEGSQTRVRAGKKKNLKKSYNH